MAYSIGIDLGTTNTVVSTARRGINGDIVVKTEEIEQMDEDGMGYKSEKLLPSVLYVDGETPYVGIMAKAMKGQTLENVIFNSKNRIGEDNCIWNIGRKEYNPSIVASYFLKAIRKQLEERYRSEDLESLNSAVITVPASFNSDQKNATKRAAQLAGFKGEIILISEPTAAMLDLINEESKKADKDRSCDFSDFKNVLVFDLGGGTCDVSILKIKLKGREVYVEEEGVSPHTLIGGTNFDFKAMEGVIYDYEKQNNIKLSKELKEDDLKMLKSKLLVILEKAKTMFAFKILNAKRNDMEVKEEDLKFPIQIPSIINGNPFKFTITNKDYNRYIESLLNEESNENIIKPIKQALEIVDYKIDDIDYVFCVGGMTRYPKVLDVVEKYLNKPVLKLAEAMESVSKGASIYHYYEVKGIEKEENINSEKENKKYIVTPKLPQTVFLNVQRGLPIPLIKGQTKAGEVIRYDSLLEVTSEVGITLDLYAGTSIYDPKLKRINSCTMAFPYGVPIGSKISLTVEYKHDGNLEFNAWVVGMEDIKIDLTIEGDMLNDEEVKRLQNIYKIEEVGGVL